jgi:hypothetical protein
MNHALRKPYLLILLAKQFCDFVVAEVNIVRIFQFTLGNADPATAGCPVVLSSFQ